MIRCELSQIPDTAQESTLTSLSLFFTSYLYPSYAPNFYSLSIPRCSLHPKNSSCLGSPLNRHTVERLDNTRLNRTHRHFLPISSTRPITLYQHVIRFRKEVSIPFIYKSRLYPIDPLILRSLGVIVVLLFSQRKIWPETRYRYQECVPVITFVYLLFTNSFLSLAPLYARPLLTSIGHQQRP